jgi:mycofactocin system glycosyltransferase
VPAGFRVLPDPATRLLDGVLVGGAPVRVLRLTASGARQVAGWLDGKPVGDSPGARKLARKLLDAGITHPDPGPDAAARPGSPGPADVTVVIPVKDRHGELTRCLGGLITARSAAADEAPLEVIVVDDCSADSAGVEAVAAAVGARVIRRPVNGGPGAARNTGLAAATTQLVAFLDSDCVPSAGWLDALLPHFADPAVGAVAPRIVPAAAGAVHPRGGDPPSTPRGWLARYEGASSTLDMGARPSIVRPGSRVSYVPGAALVVRREAAGAGFTPGMHVGEDVDFIWRLAASGWRVRYEPAAQMGHQHRVRLVPWMSRRADYGTSAAILEDLHPGSVRPLYASWWTVAAWGAVAASGSRRRLPIGITAAAGVTAVATALLARKLSRVTGDSAQAWRLAARLAGGGTLAAGRPIGSAISRTWWPVVVPLAAALPWLRLPAAALTIAPAVLDWADRKPPLDPARYVAARLLDDVAYSAGVWKGCVDRKSFRSLLPVLGSRQLPGR